VSFLRGHWQLLALSALVLALWTTPAILPLKILVVFLHELSHGLAALATGGSVESITVNADQGGLTVTRGGSRFWILSAGYLGSLLLGLLFLFAALRTRLDRAFLALLGALVLAVTALYMRELFAAGFGVFAGVAMLAMARYLPHQVNDLFLRLIGLTCLFYAPLDIFSDTIQRAHLAGNGQQRRAFPQGSDLRAAPRSYPALFAHHPSPLVAVIFLGQKETVARIKRPRRIQTGEGPQMYLVESYPIAMGQCSGNERLAGPPPT
jgi:hypothetical protein